MEIQLEDRPLQDKWPQRCLECAKTTAPTVHDGCKVCQDLEFQEEVFCSLNRAVQEPNSFDCHAFRPRLEIVGPQVSKEPEPAKTLRIGTRRRHFERLLRSDRSEYQKALALQRLERNPGGVFLELKYHIAWNVIRRRKAFPRPAEVFDYVHHVFSNYAGLVGGFVTLLYLAPDHLHVCLNSDGERSVEQTVVEMKRLSEKDLRGSLPGINVNWEKDIGLWDTAYFVESMR